MPARYATIPPPTIIDLLSDELVMVSGPMQAPRPRLLAVVGVSGGADAPVTLEASIRPVAPEGTPAASWTDLGIFPAFPGRIDATAVGVGNAYELRVRGITADGRPSAWATATHTVLGKQAGSAPLTGFDITARPDGSRRVRWALPNPTPPDLAGVRVRYGSAGQAWASMTPLHEGLLPLLSPADLALPPAGEWLIAGVIVDASGRESEAVYITATIGAPSQAGVIAIEDARNAGWNGTQTSCSVNGTNDLVGTAGTTMVYEHGAYDLGDEMEFQPSVRVDADGQAIVELATSTDGSTYTDWTNAPDLAGSLTRARYVKMRATVNPTADFPTPTLWDMSLYIRGELMSHEITNLDTSTVPAANRYAAGDINLPLPAGFAGSVRSVFVSFVGTTYQGWTWSLATRTASPGPRIKIYNAAGVLADARIDALIRAWPKVAELIGESGTGGYGGAGHGRNSEAAPPPFDVP